MGYHKLTPIIAKEATEPRYLEDRFADIISVKDFGAKGDGITDDAASFEAAAESGQPVFIPHGTYYLSESVSGRYYSDGKVSFTGKSVEVSSLVDADAMQKYMLMAMCGRPGEPVGQLIDTGNGTDDETNWRQGINLESACSDFHTGDLYVKTADDRNSPEVSRIKKLQWDASTNAYYVVSQTPDTSATILGHQGFDLYKPSANSPLLFFSYNGATHMLNVVSWSGVDGEDVVLEKAFYVLDSGMATGVSVSRNGFSDVVYTGLCPCISLDRKKVACRMIRSSDKKLVVRVWDIEHLLDAANNSDQSNTYEISVDEPDWSVWKYNTAYDLTRQAFAFDGKYFYCYDSHTGYGKHYIKVFDVCGKAVFERPGTMEGVNEERDMRSYEGEGLFWGKNPYGATTLLMLVSIFDGLGTEQSPITVRHGWLYDMCVRTSTKNPLAVSDWVGPDVWIQKIERNRNSTVKDSIFVKNEGLILDRFSSADSLYPLRINYYGSPVGGIGSTSNYVLFESSNDVVLTAREGSNVGSGDSVTQRKTASIRLYSNDSYKSLAPNHGDLSDDISLGTGSYRWNNLYLAETTGTVDGSDARLKDNIDNISDSLLSAWSKVDFKMYQFKSAISKKGTDNARLHAGLIAQEIEDAFASEGLDARRYGFFCYDEWPDQFDEDVVVDIPEQHDEHGNKIADAVWHKEQKLVMPAGNMYSIRYTEALILECTYLRSRIEKMQEQIDNLTSLISQLTSNNSNSN